MNTFNMTCAAVEVTLDEYVDETLEEWVRKPIEEHLAECVRCAALARDLRNNAREASALPALVPERDPWGRIATRIGIPVIVSEPVAQSEPITPTTEPIVLASDPISISEPAEVTSEPPVLAREPSLPTTEPLATASEPLLALSTAPLPTTAPAVALADYREKRWRQKWMGLAAAALVLVTAGTTFLLTEQWLGPARAPKLASTASTGKLSSKVKSTAEQEIRGPSRGREQVAADSSTAALAVAEPGSALTVSAASAPQVTRSPEEVVYDKEINSLQRIVRRQQSELDTSTVAVIDKNLRTLDSAIAQIRAALKKDPGSPLLGGQASRALEMKVELLRRAAMLRSST